MRVLASLFLLILISFAVVDSLSMFRRIPLPTVDRYLKDVGDANRITANKRFTADMLFNEEEWPPRFI